MFERLPLTASLYVGRNNFSAENSNHAFTCYEREREKIYKSISDQRIREN